MSLEHVIAQQDGLESAVIDVSINAHAVSSEWQCAQVCRFPRRFLKYPQTLWIDNSTIWPFKGHIDKKTLAPSLLPLHMRDFMTTLMGLSPSSSSHYWYYFLTELRLCECSWAIGYLENYFNQWFYWYPAQEMCSAKNMKSNMHEKRRKEEEEEDLEEEGGRRDPLYPPELGLHSWRQVLIQAKSVKEHTVAECKHTHTTRRQKPLNKTRRLVWSGSTEDMAAKYGERNYSQKISVQLQPAGEQRCMQTTLCALYCA